MINTSALNYQSNVGIDFTFNPTLSINISLSNLVIDNLTPGTASDSNIIKVSVATNAAYGYTLSAIVNGDNSNLTHTNGTNTFSSIATNASLSNLTTDNTWGYSYKNNIAPAPTWSSYSGLATNTSKVLLETNEAANSSSVDFKIAAKASNTQPSGIYTGTINFLVIAKPRPKVITDLEYLQDFADLDEVNLASVKSSMPVHSTFTLKDKRDEQEYTIAKLADGKIWMTKNLNLAGEAVLSDNNTDVDNSYIDNFSTSNNLTKANNSIILPTSNTSGFSNNNYAYVYNSNDTNCSNINGCFSYYSWDAATLGSGRNISTDNTDAPYSICPKGWKLPSTYNGTDNLTDFRALMIAYGGSSDIQIYNNNTSPTGATIYNVIKIDTVPNFLLTGYYYNGSLEYNGYAGRYWSSTSYGTNVYARYLYFYSSYINSAISGARGLGYAVRCLAK